MSLTDQNNLTAEDRAWWIKRINKEAQNRREAEAKQAQSNRPTRMPRRR